MDGTKIEANANKHKVVWAKRTQKNQARLQEKIQELLQQIKEVNEAEQAEYGDRDLEELGRPGKLIDAQKFEEKITELNHRLSPQGGEVEDPSKRKVLVKLERECLQRQRKYEVQERTLAERNSYARTDAEATCFRMKDDRGAGNPWPKPAYNVQMGTENQFVVGFSLHRRAGDTGCLIPHLRGLKKSLGRLPQNVSADAGYGSEENYAFLEEHGVGNFVKYNTFHQDQIRHRKTELIRRQSFRAENFPYAAERDQFLCPA